MNNFPFDDSTICIKFSHHIKKSSFISSHNSLTNLKFTPSGAGLFELSHSYTALRTSSFENSLTNSSHDLLQNNSFSLLLSPISIFQCSFFIFNRVSKNHNTVSQTMIQIYTNVVILSLLKTIDYLKKGSV